MANAQTWIKRHGDPIIYELSSGTASDTVSATNDDPSWTLPYVIGNQSYSVQFIGDSLSGSTGVSLYLQKSENEVGWTNVDTVTVNGTQTIDFSSSTSAWPSARMRVLADGGGATQSTRIRIWVTLKEIK